MSGRKHRNAAPEGEPVVEFVMSHLSFEEQRGAADISFRVARGETRIILGRPPAVEKVRLHEARQRACSCRIAAMIGAWAGRLQKMCEEKYSLCEPTSAWCFRRVRSLTRSMLRTMSPTGCEEEHVPQAEVHERVQEALKLRGTGEGDRQVPVRVERRHAAPGLHRVAPSSTIPTSSCTTRPPAVLTRSTSNNDHRAGRKAARRLRHHFSADYPPVAGRLHAGDPPLQPGTGHMEKIPNGGIDPNTRFLVLNDGQVVFDGATLELARTSDPWLK